MGHNCDLAIAAELLNQTGKCHALEKEVRRFLALLARTDITYSGTEWHPIAISCCRAVWGMELSECLHKLKELTGGTNEPN